MSAFEIKNVILESCAVKKQLVIAALVLTLAATALAHPRHTDPVLAELNDYLVALQLLKDKDAHAEQLFKLWQSVREGSWEIRRSTDKENLPIDAPAVSAQILKTRTLREELLQRCRRYLSEQEDLIPTARFIIGDEISVQQLDTVIETPVASRTVVLIKIENRRATDVHIDLFNDRSDQILFWKKSMELGPDSSHYTFAYVAPVKEGSAKSTIFLREEDGDSAEVIIKANGTALSPDPTGAGDDPCTIQPAQDKSIRFRIREQETNEPLPVRVEVRDQNDRAFWTPLRGASYAVTKEQAGWQTPLWQFQTGPYFYIDGEAELGVDPAGKTVRLYHGFEYEPVMMKVPDNGVVEAAPRRWINMAAKGWYSGHTHIHTTDAGMPVQFSRFWPLVARAEDICVSNILTLKGEWETDPIYANEYPMGLVQWACREGQIIAYGQEYRNNPYGHLCLIGIDELIEPISTGALGELGGPDFPPNALVLDVALAQNAATIGAHFGLSILSDKQIKSSWPSTGFEMPVDVALKKIQIAEVYGIGGQGDVWYKLLNCGFELPATAGPDWDIKDTPRTYVYLGSEPLTFERWKEALKEGRSFITKGPMIFLTVDGHMPGARLNYSKRPKEVVIRASAVLPGKSLPIKVIVNGEVIAEGKDIDKSIRLENSCWIAARCRGAHTSPIYVTFEGRPRASAKEAKEFLGVIDRLTEWVNTKAMFDSPQQKQTVLDVIRQGRAVYESIVQREQQETKKRN